MLFFQLSSPLSLFPLDTLTLLEGKHLLVFHPQLPSVQFKMIQRLNHRSGLFGRGKIRKRQSTEDPVVEVIVEGVGERKVHVRHQRYQLLFLDSKWDVLNHNGRGNQFIFGFLYHICFSAQVRSCQWDRSQAREVIWNGGLLIKPCLRVG